MSPAVATQLPTLTLPQTLPQTVPQTVPQQRMDWAQISPKLSKLPQIQTG